MFRGSLSTMASGIRHIAFIRRFVRARRGAVAVEFAFVALPFIMLLMALFELAMVFIVSMVLETATEESARMIRTGAFQTSGANTKADFRNLVCSNMSWFRTNCGTKMAVEVETFGIDDFEAMAASTAPDLTGYPNITTCFAPGNAGDVVMVRTLYEWKLFTPLLNQALVNAGGDMRLISSVAAFRNEPFNNGNPTGALCTPGPPKG
jgi:Flp pilus assembly protein TadG